MVAPRKRTAGRTFIQRSRDVSPEEKATFHQETGAGRGRVKRKFFGLSKNDEDAIGKVIEDAIDEAFKKP